MSVTRRAAIAGVVSVLAAPRLARADADAGAAGGTLDLAVVGGEGGAASDASESESATVRIDFDTCAHFNVYAEIWKRYIYTGCWPGPVDPIDPGSLGVRASADRPAHVVLPDGDGLSMRILERPRGGEASVDAGGLVYVPRRDFVGRDRVYVDVGNGSCSVRTVIDIDVPATGVAR